MLLREQSDLGPFFLQHRLPKNISRRVEQMTKVINGGLKCNMLCYEQRWKKMWACKFECFIKNPCVMDAQKNRLNVMVLLSTVNTCLN